METIPNNYRTTTTSRRRLYFSFTIHSVPALARQCGKIKHEAKELREKNFLAPKANHYRTVAKMFAELFSETKKMVDGRNLQPNGLQDANLYGYIVVVLNILQYATAPMDDTKRKLENPYSPLVEDEFEIAITELQRIQRNLEKDESAYQGYDELIRTLLDAKNTISSALDAPPFRMFDSRTNVQSFQHQLCPDLPFRNIKELWPDNKEEALKFIVSNFRNNYDKAVHGQTQGSNYNLYPTLEQVLEDFNESTFRNELQDDDEDAVTKQNAKQSNAKRKLSGNFERARQDADNTEQPTKKKKSTPAKDNSPAIITTRSGQKTTKSAPTSPQAVLPPNRKRI
jgi:hypothetical protein